MLLNCKGTTMENFMSENQVFNIQFVSNMTGINPHTIRAWEKRYSAIVPQRDSNGRRLYTNIEINRLHTLNKLVKLGNSISDIASLPDNDLKDISKKFGINSNTEETFKNFDFDSCLTNVEMSLNFFKLDVLNHEIEKAANSLSSKLFALRIIQPVMNQIRKMKEERALSENQRQQIYVILKSHLHRKLYLSYKQKNESKKRVLIASPDCSLNEIGTMVATILFLDAGLNVDFIGTNVEAGIVGQISSQFKPDYIFLGLNYSRLFSQEQSTEYIKTVAQYITPSTQLCIGAYDFCVTLPDSDIQCFSKFEDLSSHIEKL
jgi:DNA-binding transcriptional MerR regulator